MTPTPTLETSHPRTSPPRRRPPIALLIGVAAALALLWSVTGALAAPDTIDRLTIDNPTDFDLELSLRNGETGRILLLGPVSAGETKVVADVIDPGDRFVVEVSSAGVTGSEVAFERAAVAGADWTIVLPADVVEPIASNGVTPTTEPAG